MKFPSSHQPHWKGASNRSYVYQVDSKTGLQPLSPCLWVYFGCAEALLLHGLSLVVESGASSPVAVLELLPGEASLVEKSRGSRAHGLQESQQVCSVVVAPELQSPGSGFVTPGLSCSAACGIFPDQGLNPCILHRQADSFPLSHQRSP